MPHTLAFGYAYMLVEIISALHTLNLNYMSPICTYDVMLDASNTLSLRCDPLLRQSRVDGDARWSLAPEALLMDTADDWRARDSFALGCVLSELLLGVQLFAAHEPGGQLLQMFKVLGIPSRKDLSFLQPSHAYDLLVFPASASTPAFERFCTEARVPPSLLRGLLAWDPSLRRSPASVLIQMRDVALGGRKLPELDIQIPEKEAQPEAEVSQIPAQQDNDISLDITNDGDMQAIARVLQLFGDALRSHPSVPSEEPRKSPPSGRVVKHDTHRIEEPESGDENELKVTVEQAHHLSPVAPDSLLIVSYALTSDMKPILSDPVAACVSPFFGHSSSCTLRNAVLKRICHRGDLAFELWCVPRAVWDEQKHDKAIPQDSKLMGVAYVGLSSLLYGLHELDGWYSLRGAPGEMRIIVTPKRTLSASPLPPAKSGGTKEIDALKRIRGGVERLFQISRLSPEPVKDEPSKESAIEWKDDRPVEEPPIEPKEESHSIAEWKPASLATESQIQHPPDWLPATAVPSARRWDIGSLQSDDVDITERRDALSLSLDDLSRKLNGSF